MPAAAIERIDSVYLTDVAAPMVLIGAGQGLAFAPLTAAGIAGVAAKDAGAASGLINTAHQLGGSLGLGVLVAVAAAAPDAAASVDGTAGRVSLALTGGSARLAVALAVAVATVLPIRRRRGIDRSGDALHTSEPLVVPASTDRRNERPIRPTTTTRPTTTDDTARESTDREDRP